MLFVHITHALGGTVSCCNISQFHGKSFSFTVYYVECIEQQQLLLLLLHFMNEKFNEANTHIISLKLCFFYNYCALARWRCFGWSGGRFALHSKLKRIRLAQEHSIFYSCNVIVDVSNVSISNDNNKYYNQQNDLQVCLFFFWKQKLVKDERRINTECKRKGH